MSEIHRKVTPYEFNYLCDKCKNGMMMVCGGKKPNGDFPHKCMICGAQADLKRAYPHIQHFGEGEEPTD